jgi:hypothetical protein
MTRFTRTTMLSAAMAFVVVAGLGSSAHADVEGAYADDVTYNLKITHMPDFDQRRKSATGLVGLPNNGSMYCVPTATMNLFAYAANHGYPNIAPGPAWWQSQSHYNDAGINILTLGLLMGTNPSDGTGAQSAQAGAAAWLSGSLLTCDTFIASGNWSPTITHITHAVLSGGIVAFGYGRYDYLGEAGGTAFVGARQGGHRVTLAQATRSGNAIIIKVRDPADDPDDLGGSSEAHLFSQSPFANRAFASAQQKTVISIAGPWTRFSTSLINPPPTNSNGVQRMLLISSYIVVKPLWGLTWQPGINNNPPKIKFKMPQFGGAFGSADTTYELIDFNIVGDVAFGLDPGNVYVVGDNALGQTFLQEVNVNTGVAMNVAQLDRAADLVFGRKRELYALSRDQLWCLNVDDDTLTDPVEAQVSPPAPCEAMCYDDARDEIILLSPTERKIFRYPHRLPTDVKPHVQCIPENVMMAGDGSVHVNPVDGNIWFITDGTSVIYHVPDDPQCEPEVEMISFGEIVNPRSITFDDHGGMYIVCDAGLKKLVYNDRLARWEIVADDYFADFEIGEKFYVTKSRTNYDPAEHDGPEWNNIEPDELNDLPGSTIEIDCLADLVSSATFQPPPDGVVDAADLAFLLGEWGANEDSAADIVTSATFQPPEDGVIDAADLAFLLGAWGECP